MIKAMFFDLDRTLLNSDKLIPQSAIHAMKDCKKKGIKLFVATARIPALDKSLNWSDEIISLFDGGVYSNGAINIANNEIGYNYMDSKVVNNIVTAMKQFPYINIALQSNDNKHAFNNLLPENELGLWGVEKEKIFSIQQLDYNKILKLLIFDGEYSSGFKAIPDQVLNLIADTCGKCAKLYVTDFGKILQVVSINASKYRGVEYIRNKLGLEKDEIAVFGDDLNDLEMIKGYRNSVAMENAVDEIKVAASFVTKSNDDDGIAYAVEKLLNFE